MFYCLFSVCKRTHNYFITLHYEVNKSKMLSIMLLYFEFYASKIHFEQSFLCFLIVSVEDSLTGSVTLPARGTPPCGTGKVIKQVVAQYSAPQRGLRIRQHRGVIFVFHRYVVCSK